MMPAAPIDIPQRYGWPALNYSRPLTIAHRGASAHAAENTLRAFRVASELGAEMWELDVQLSADKVCMVSHDNSLKRRFGLDCNLSDLSFDEIKAFNIDLPELTEVIELAGQYNAGLYIELKAEGSGEIVWRTLRKHNIRFAALGSFQADWIRELRDQGCEYPLAVLVPIGADPFIMADVAGADIIHLCWERAGQRPQNLITAELIDRAHQQDRHIVLWHEERPEVLTDLLKLPVLAICSDQPELLNSYQLSPDLPIEICCHRGANRFAPENTLAAARLCFAMGMAFNEIDVRDSSDGTPVVIHDPSVNRTSNGQGLVSSLSFTEIKTLDAGSWYSSHYCNERIPSLKEMAGLAHNCGGDLYVELKQTRIDRVIEVLQQTEMLQRCFFWSFYLSHLVELQQHFAQAKIMLRRRDFSDLGTLFRQFNPWVVEFDPRFDNLNEIESCRSRGVRVMVLYLGDDHAVFRELIAQQPDMMNIDRPDIFHQVYQQYIQTL